MNIMKYHEPCQARLAAQQHALNSVEVGDGMYFIDGDGVLT